MTLAENQMWHRLHLIGLLDSSASPELVPENPGQFDDYFYLKTTLHLCDGIRSSPIWIRSEDMGALVDGFFQIVTAGKPFSVLAGETQYRFDAAEEKWIELTEQDLAENAALRGPTPVGSSLADKAMKGRWVNIRRIESPEEEIERRRKNRELERQANRHWAQWNAEHAPHAGQLPIASEPEPPSLLAGLVKIGAAITIGSIVAGLIKSSGDKR